MAGTSGVRLDVFLYVLKLVTMTDVAIATALVIAGRAACSGRETIAGIFVIFVVFSWNSAKSE